MIKLNLYTNKGTKKGTISLPKSLEEKENLVLLAQALRIYEARRHPGLSKTKTRSEVNASRRKTYRQKGTGRARHGAISAPIFVGGGKAHGPHGVKRKLDLPKKMRRRAFKAALALKVKKGQLIVVDGISNLKKTKNAASLLNKIASSEKNTGKKERFTFALGDKNKNAVLALRNIENVKTIKFSDLNAYIVHFGGTLLVDRDALGEKKLQVNKKK